MTRSRAWLVAILVFGAAARLIDLDWDQGHAFHPDERAIAFAVERLSLSPLKLNPEFFAYGSLPFYLVRTVASAVGLFSGKPADFATIILVGRSLSALAGLLTVLLLFRLGTTAFGREVGVLAAGLLSACVLHIQHSRFMTGEALLTLLALLVLASGVGYVRRGRSREAALTGAAVGLALATKVSAAPLLAPLAVALGARFLHDRRRGRALAHAATAIVALGSAFALGEPYAFLDAASFWRQVVEQGAMVRHAGSLPYTIQYLGRAKYGYDLGQLVLWGMAPPLGLAALWAALRQARSFLRERSAEAAVLWSWVLPYVLITGWFEVKFIRYLLPVYPVLILWAAASLWQGRDAGHWGRWRLRLVAGGTLLAALAFLSVYRGPHTVLAASEWAYQNVPFGRTILTPHWDEGFPLPLPAAGPDRYRVTEVPYYEPDTPQKLETLAQSLAGADVLAFPTARLYGAITRAPERFPLTDRFFHLLFAGDLGYRLVYARTSRPRLFGLEIPDELADESFSVYDHPKVVVFANEGRFSADRFSQLIAEGLPSRALDRRDILLADTNAGAGRLLEASPPVRSSPGALFRFAAAVELLGLAAFGLLRSRLPRAGGYALAKVLGVLLYAFVCGWIGHVARGGFTRPFLLAVLLAFVAWGFRGLWRGRHRSPPPDWRLGESLFWGSFLTFAAIRAWNPAVFWGEKPMDFAFLNTLTRVDSLPPPEPWFAGSRLHYGYFGHFMVAALGKLCHLHPGLTFNLGVALTGALTATAAFALGHVISGRWRVGLLAAALTTFAGNLSGPILLLGRKPIDFDYFWATSRVIENTINEYPLWSLLFADLHAHVLVMPLALTCLALVVAWIRWRKSRSAVTLALLGLTLGAIAVTSAWSAPTFALLLAVLLVAVALGERLPWPQAVARVVWPILVVPPAAWLLYLPFWRGHRAPERAWGWERQTFAAIDGYAQVFGLFLAVGVAFLLARWWRELSTRGRPVTARLRFWLVVAAIGFCLGMSLVGRSGAGTTRSAWLRIGLFGLGLLGLFLGTRPSRARSERLVALLLAWAFVVTAGCDVVYVWDRMNTVFKFYLDAWLLFAVAAAVALPWLWGRRGIGIAGRAVIVVLGAASAFTAATCLVAVLRTQRVPTRRPTLDGTAYLGERNPDEARAIEWLQRTVPGTPVIAEAWGPAYGDSARISMHTGLPTVIGWEYHVFQRAQAWPEIHAREADVEGLYTSEDEGTVTRILDRYAIAFVYVGDLERKTYGEGTGPRFARWTDVFTTAYGDGGVTIFAVKGRIPTEPPTATTTPMPAAEPAPSPEREASAPLGRLSQPRGVAVDRDGTLYVADFDHHRIQKFSAEAKPLAAWGGQGKGPGRFDQPCQVAVAGDEVYVADTWNNRVQVFDRDGGHLREWSGDFYGPRGIAVAQDGRVYVADTGNHRIRSFDGDGRPGASWGGRGSEPGQFVEPMGIGTDATGAVYVCDNGNARLQAFTADGAFLRAFPVPGWRTEIFSEPKLTLTPSGVIWVTVPLENVVRAYDRTGRQLREISGTSMPSAPFAKPMGIAYNPVAKELVIADLEGRLARIPLAQQER